jgi:hypothetical protein
MAKPRPQDAAGQRLHRTLSTPAVYLWRMLIFLSLVGFLVFIIAQPLWAALLTNPFLNGGIVLVLSVGTVYAFRQVIRLYPEIRWVNAFRIADPGLAIAHTPILLSPMATMLRDRTGSLSLSATSMRSIMDSIGGRLDEARDTGRYMVGLLVFLGLLGTFWGLLETIQSVGKAISALDTKGGDSVTVFDDLKNGLAAPLRGMGTAFSSSLLGLAGSLILGFLELQASHAHNRFYNELEEWLSGITELTPGSGSAEALNRQLYAAMFDVQRAIAEMSQRISLPATGAANGAETSVRELAKGVDQLVRQMRAEQKVVREWVDEQAARQTELSAVLRDLSATITRRGG